MRKKINELMANHRVLVEELSEVSEEHVHVEFELIHHDEARTIIQKSAQITQKNLEEHISNIVTKALKIVFLDEAKPFSVEFVTRRNSTECDLRLIEHGELMDPLDSCGFGEADVVSFALRIAYWSLGSTRNTMVVDEPFRNLDTERKERAAEMVKILSTELGLQIIFVTHIDEMYQYADKSFKVVKNKNGISKVVS